MTARRKIELFSAGCPVCSEAVETVTASACPSCEIVVLDMADPAVTERARRVGVRSLPAVLVDGELADCCRGRGVDLAVLRQRGLGHA